MPDTGVEIKISADVSEYQSGIIRSFVATLGPEGRAALLDALLLEAEGLQAIPASYREAWLGELDCYEGLAVFESKEEAERYCGYIEEGPIYVPKEPTDGE